MRRAVVWIGILVLTCLVGGFFAIDKSARWWQDDEPDRSLRAVTDNRGPESGSSTAQLRDREPLAAAPSDAPERTGFRGRVVDILDSAIFGARVEAYPSASRDAAGQPTASTTTDARGEFELAVAPRSSYAITVSHPEFAPRHAIPNLWSRQGEMRDLGAIRMRSGLVIQGVVHNDRNIPFAGCGVLLEPELSEDVGPFGPSVRESYTTSADGRFTFLALARAEYRLTVRPSDKRHSGLRLRNVRAREANAPALRIRLPLGYPVRGSLRRADGAPVAGAAVELQPLAGNQAADASTQADGNGTWTTPALAPGRYRVIARASDSPHAPFVQREISVPSPDPVALVLPATKPIHLPLVAKVALPERARISLWLPGARHRPGGRGAREVRIEQNAIRFDHLPPGVWEVEVRVQGFAPGRTRIDTRADLALKPVLLHAEAVVEGSVTDADGKPVSGLEIGLCDAAALSRSLAAGRLLAAIDGVVLARTRTDDAGSYRFDGLPGVGYVLRSLGPGARVLAHGTSAPGVRDERDLRWPPAGGSVRVRLADADRPEFASVQIWSDDGRWSERRTFPASGVVHFETLPPGRYGLRLLPGAGPAKFVQVSEGKTVPASLR